MAKSKTKLDLPETITFDQWAESGGTVGIYAKGVRSGKIKIVEEDFGEGDETDPYDTYLDGANA